MDVRAKIEQLRDELHAHNHRYYVLAEPTISDREFDALLEELATLESAHPEFDDPTSPTKRVGGDLTDKFDKVPHRSPMLSCLLYTSPSPRDRQKSRMPSSA